MHIDNIFAATSMKKSTMATVQTNYSTKLLTFGAVQLNLLVHSCSMINTLNVLALCHHCSRRQRSIIIALQGIILAVFRKAKNPKYCKGNRAGKTLEFVQGYIFVARNLNLDNYTNR